MGHPGDDRRRRARPLRPRHGDPPRSDRGIPRPPPRRPPRHRLQHGRRPRTGRIAKLTFRRFASSTAFPTPVATRSRSRSASTKPARKKSSATTACPRAPFVVVERRPIGACRSARPLDASGIRSSSSPSTKDPPRASRKRILPHPGRAPTSKCRFSSMPTASPSSSKNSLRAPSSPARSSATADGRVLPLVGMNFAALPAGALPVYGFEAKWVWDDRERRSTIFECPASNRHALRGIEDVILRCLSRPGLPRLVARSTCDSMPHGVPNVVEVNPLPGILPESRRQLLFPQRRRARPA